jgi:hypothetical protein
MIERFLAQGDNACKVEVEEWKAALLNKEGN